MLSQHFTNSINRLDFVEVVSLNISSQADIRHSIILQHPMGTLIQQQFSKNWICFWNSASCMQFDCFYTFNTLYISLSGVDISSQADGRCIVWVRWSGQWEIIENCQEKTMVSNSRPEGGVCYTSPRSYQINMKLEVQQLHSQVKILRSRGILIKWCNPCKIWIQNIINVQINPGGGGSPYVRFKPMSMQ